jgi:hypothetical protein
MVLRMITAIRRIANSSVVTAFVASVILVAPVPALAQLHTEIKPTMPDLGLGNTTADDSPVVCRAPQPQTDSRLLGPRVCRTQRQWDDLHKQGLDVSADGHGVVASEKYRSMNPLACGSNGSCGP